MFTGIRSRAALVACIFLSARAVLGAESKVSSADDPDYRVQGEYSGQIKPPGGGDELKLGVQVIALGGGKFHAVAYPGGLPGDGWDGTTKLEADGEMSGEAALFKGVHANGEIKNGMLRIIGEDNETLTELPRLERKSPTLGAAPPQGAIVLFGGSAANDFDPGTLSDEGWLIAGQNSKRKFGSCQLHVEFLLPFMPEARGQARANSGCYLQGRYEVQMLDSFGLKGENNECGGIYSIKAPDVNMCFPPLAWQTFDIDYTAATYENGNKTKNARMRVRHNGVVIHNDVEVPKNTTAAPVPEGPDAGPIYLQNHGNPVRYRNIWIVEKP